MDGQMPPGRMAGQMDQEAGEQGEQKGEMKSFYIPGYPNVGVGDTVKLKVIGQDKDSGDLEVEWAGKGQMSPQEYTPEEPPADAFNNA